MSNLLAKLIVFEDENFCFICKPAGMLSIPSRQNTTETNVQNLAAANNWLICHRLDRLTSGIMVIAKHPQAHKEASLAFQKKQVTKTYHALVNGNTQFNQTSVQLPLITKGNKVVVNRNEGKLAQTELTTLKNYRHFSLIACFPKTGRQHQIRVHLQSQNYPIVGDELYGGTFPKLVDFKRKFTGNSTATLIKRFVLQAKAIAFTACNINYAVETPYEKDIETLLRILDRWDS